MTHFVSYLDRLARPTFSLVCGKMSLNEAHFDDPFEIQRLVTRKALNFFRFRPMQPHTERKSPLISYSQAAGGSFGSNLPLIELGRTSGAYIRDQGPPESCLLI